MKVEKGEITGKKITLHRDSSYQWKSEEEALAFLEEMKKNTGMQDTIAMCIRLG